MRFGSVFDPRPYLPLQWGRDQLIAEMDQWHFRERPTHLLQWGRDQLIAEMLLTQLLSVVMYGFNGAAIS